jgi:hypothetical protein
MRYKRLFSIHATKVDSIPHHVVVQDRLNIEPTLLSEGSTWCAIGLFQLS